jgi:hypothetical protein
MTDGGMAFVDGGIVGPATLTPGRTWLYLSGEMADEASSYLSDGPMAAEPIGREVGKASALKICYAANNKGKLILQCATAAAAQQLGVWDELQRQWMRDGAKPHDIEGVFQMVAPRAWRWAPEMVEIAETFESMGQPRGFHEAAAAICRELAAFKDAQAPSVASVLEALGAPTRAAGR